jgi:hypothetical protein
MDEHSVSRDVSIWQTLRERIVARNEAREDDPDLLTILDNETGLNARLERLAVAAISKERMAEGLRVMVSDWKLRIARLEREAEYERGLIAWAMQETDQKTLRMASFTVTQRMAHAKVVIDEAALPDEWKKSKVTLIPDKELIEEALDEGTEVPGVTLSNPMPILTIRGK